MKKKVTILMLGGAKRVSLARLLKEAGRRRGVEVVILSYEIIPTVPIACEGRIIAGRRWRDADALDHLVQTVADEAVDIVLPFVDGAIEVASRLKERCPQVFVPVSPFEVAHAMFDKTEAAELFAEEGICIPATYTPDNCRFPAIMKPREGSASKGIVVVNSREELEKVGHFDRYLIQEYIADSEEYTVDCYVSTVDGEVLCAVPRIRLSTSGGEVDRTETRRIDELLEASDSILRRLGFRGPVTLQFLFDKATGRYLLMEINPRLGGGVVCSILAGADIPSMLLAEAAGEKAEPCRNWRDRALMARYFSEVMFFNDEQ